MYALLVSKLNMDRKNNALNNTGLLGIANNSTTAQLSPYRV